MDKNKFSISDIIDALLAIGGFGFVLIILATLVPFKGFLVLLGALGIGSLGIGRILLRQKKHKNQMLENPSVNNNPQFISQKNYQDDLEVRFLEALILQKGRITLTEAVVLVRESVDKLLPIIQRLQSKGVIGTDIDDKGQIVYINA